jgi:hypothetical protein
LKQKEDESRDQNEDCAGLHDPETEWYYLEEDMYRVHRLFIFLNLLT